MALPHAYTADPRPCDEIEALLPLVADGSLDERQDPGLFDHLARCERCQDSLTTHDLVTLSLESRPRSAMSAAPRVIRPDWTRFIPAAAAALLVVSATAWLTSPGAPGAASQLATTTTTHAPVVTAKATPKLVTPATGSPTTGAPLVPAAAPATAQPVVAQATPSSAPVDIEVEVVTVPGSTPSHPRYLVRRGEQVMLVDPTRPAVESNSDAKPASFRY